MYDTTNRFKGFYVIEVDEKTKEKREYCFRHTYKEARDFAQEMWFKDRHNYEIKETPYGKIVEYKCSFYVEDEHGVRW